jgi:Signal transduction histidine kinase
MNIKALVTTNYPTLDAYDGRHTANRLLQTHDALVILEENHPVGVLTLTDLAMKPHGLVIDCLPCRPVVTCTDSIGAVLNLMATTRNSVLPVTRGEKFYGIIKQTDILSHLHKTHEKQSIALLAAAHDLHSPVATINMLGNILRASPALTEHRSLIDKLSEICDYTQVLIQDIFTTEQLQGEALSIDEEKPDDLINECIDSVADKLAAKRLMLSRHLNCNKIIKADCLKLKRAILNLLENSIKFTQPGGKIDVSSRETADQKILIVIRDTGIGIPAEIRESIFDKFTKAKRVGTAGEPTTGLGLYLTKVFIELHGGTIDVESDGRSGTTFIVSIPLP